MASVIRRSCFVKTISERRTARLAQYSRYLRFNSFFSSNSSGTAGKVHDTCIRIDHDDINRYRFADLISSSATLHSSILPGRHSACRLTMSHSFPSLRTADNSTFISGRHRLNCHTSAFQTDISNTIQTMRTSVTPSTGLAWGRQLRCMSSAHDSIPPELTRGSANSLNIPVGGEGLYRRGTNIGMPMLFLMRYDKPTWQPLWEDEHEVIPRDGYGVPAHIPPEVSQDIKHVYYVPPQFYAFLKKLGEDTPALKPYMQKLIRGEFTHDDYEELFYKFAKPLKIYRQQVPLPYRTAEEVAREDEVAWEGAWLSYRQRVLACYNSAVFLRELVFGCLVGIYFAWLFLDQHRQYRLDMKLFYLEAPEHKINWVKPRGDLV